MSIKIIEQNLENKLKDMFVSEQFNAKMNELKEIENDKAYQFKVVVTTEGVDRDGEVVKADGIQFENYMKNPVVLVDHSYKIESIVGKTTKIYQEGGKTIAEGVFAKGIEKAELIRSLYNQGFVKTVSIGFIAKKRDDSDNTVISQSEMLEFSFVAVPANPEALSLDGKTYQKCLDLGIIKEEKAIEDDYSGAVMLNISNGLFDFIDIDYIDLYFNDNLWGGGGREYNKHITLLYGLSGNVSKKDVLDKINYNNEKISITGISIFEQDNYDVLIGEVETSDFLVNANKSLKELDHKNDFPDYKPHITLAYLKKGRAINYIDSETKLLNINSKGILFSPSGENGSVIVKNNEVDMKDVLNIMTSLRDDVSEMKTNLKTSVEDNAEENNRKAAQELVKGVSAYLAKTKKSAK